MSWGTEPPQSIPLDHEDVWEREFFRSKFASTCSDPPILIVAGSKGRSARQIAHGVAPSLFQLVDLFGGETLLGVPALEAVVFGRVTVFVLLQDLLTAGTMDEIG